MNRDILERPFPDVLIRSRKGPFGQSFSYIEGHEVIKRLNEALEGEWSFEIVEHHIRDAEVVVVGKLTAGMVTKMAFGGSSITVSREGEVLALADDLKAAATDALKKAASLLGVGLHLYASEPAAATDATVHAKPAAKPEARGNGNGSKNGNGARDNGGAPRSDRLTQKQLSAIWSMGRALGQNAEAIRQRAVEVYGSIPEQLDRSSASAFITELGEALGSNGRASAA